MCDVVIPEIRDDRLLRLIRGAFLQGRTVHDVSMKGTKDMVVDCDDKINTLLVRCIEEDSTEIDVHAYVFQAEKEIPKDNGKSKSRFAHEGDYVIVLTIRPVTVLSELGKEVPALSFLTDKRATKGETTINRILCKRSLSEIINESNFRFVGHTTQKVTTVARGKTHDVEKSKGGREVVVSAILLNAKRPNQKCDYEILWVEHGKCYKNAAANKIGNYDQESITQSVNVAPEFIDSQDDAVEHKSPDCVSNKNDGDEGGSVYDVINGGMNWMMEDFFPFGGNEKGESVDDDDKECGTSGMNGGAMYSMNSPIDTNEFEKTEDPKCSPTSSPSSDPLHSSDTSFSDQGQYDQKGLMMGLSPEKGRKLVKIDCALCYDDGVNFIEVGNVCGIEPPSKKNCLERKYC